MRKNEYTSLEEFTSQYVGEWGPSDELLGKYDSMDELLESRVIGSRPFREVIMDDDTVLLGQD